MAVDTHQPRYRSTMCRVCLARSTSNVHAVCSVCVVGGRCVRCRADPLHVVWPELARLPALH